MSMPGAEDDDLQYDSAFAGGLQWMWGEGWLSPGGPAEVAVMLRDVSLDGAQVLDVGSGLGGADVELVQRHGAASVVGIDVEAPLVEQARARARSGWVWPGRFATNSSRRGRCRSPMPASMRCSPRMPSFTSRTRPPSTPTPGGC